MSQWNFKNNSLSFTYTTLICTPGAKLGQRVSTCCEAHQGGLELKGGEGEGLTDYSGLQINEDGSWHVLAGAGLAEEGVERVVTTSDGLVAGHLAIRLDSVLQAVQLPAGVSDLDSGLSDVDGDTFPLSNEKKRDLVEISCGC